MATAVIPADTASPPARSVDIRMRLNLLQLKNGEFPILHLTVSKYLGSPKYTLTCA
ncbi:hypothetical protein HMPREF0578_1428 [Mobiluncus mulieris 28-1]|nr:hypothetical protein HMPREF0578_1428 [Mobiluncus mulieris 28-1]